MFVPCAYVWLNPPPPTHIHIHVSVCHMIDISVSVLRAEMYWKDFFWFGEDRFRVRMFQCPEEVSVSWPGVTVWVGVSVTGRCQCYDDEMRLWKLVTVIRPCHSHEQVSWGCVGVMCQCHDMMPSTWRCVNIQIRFLTFWGYFNNNFLPTLCRTFRCVEVSLNTFSAL